jgi:integrase
VLLYHGLRREELCTLKVRDIHARRGVLHLRVHGKGGKVRYLPLHPGTAELVADYLEIAGHAGEMAGALFRPVKNNTGGTVEGAISADGIYKMVKHYAKRVGVNIEGCERIYYGPADDIEAIEGLEYLSQPIQQSREAQHDFFEDWCRDREKKHRLEM